MPIGICPVCKKKKPLSLHHVFRFAVFKKEEPTILICERCHNQGTQCLEALITERENDVLLNKPELYTKALADYMKGVRPKKKTYKKRRRAK